jgi:hypothetical protein
MTSCHVPVLLREDSSPCLYPSAFYPHATASGACQNQASTHAQGSQIQLILARFDGIGQVRIQSRRFPMNSADLVEKSVRKPKSMVANFFSSNNFLNPGHMLLFVFISFLELNVILRSIHPSIKASSELDSVNQALLKN